VVTAIFESVRGSRKQRAKTALLTRTGVPFVLCFIERRKLTADALFFFLYRQSQGDSGIAFAVGVGSAVVGRAAIPISPAASGDPSKTTRGMNLV